MAAVSLEADYDVLADAAGTLPEIFADWSSASRDAADAASGIRTVRYGRGDDLAYDIIYPVGKPRGAVIFLHGGFWVQGSKDSVLFPHRNFTDAGLCYVAVTYGLAPRYRLDALVANVELASRSLAGLAPEIGLDPSRIALIGHSAGAYLAAALARSPRRAFIPLATLLISGLFDLTEVHDLDRIEALKLSAGDAARLSIRGSELAGTGEMILAVGSREPAGFQRQTARLERELRDTGERPISLVMAGRDHFSVARDLGAPDSKLAAALLNAFD